MDILQIVRAAMTERAKKQPDIFRFWRMQKQKHMACRNQVYFHGVGAVDSIVDILSVAVCLDNLDIDQVIVTELCEGRGTVRCQRHSADPGSGGDKYRTGQSSETETYADRR